jgi:hypothetical protein
MIWKLSGVTQKPSCFDRLTVFTDGNDDYMFVLPKYYPLGLVDYGQLVKIRERSSCWEGAVGCFWGFVSCGG